MNAESILAKQQAFFYSEKTKPYAFRIRALEALKKLLSGMKGHCRVRSGKT